MRPVAEAEHPKAVVPHKVVTTSGVPQVRLPSAVAVAAELSVDPAKVVLQNPVAPKVKRVVPRKAAEVSS